MQPSLIRSALIALLCAVIFAAAPAAAQSPAAASVASAFDHDFIAIDGAAMPLSTFRGKALLIVNTASFCGFTPQYTGLQQLHEAYAARGLVVIGVPSNDFGDQEPKANGEIAEFCQGAFNITFPLAEKQIVKGDAAHPFYRWAAKTMGTSSAPRWNFHKYLVGRDGRLRGAFPSEVTPQSKTMISAIEAALNKAP